MNEQICGTCIYHHKIDDDWMCTNKDSECYADWTEYNDSCPDWEGKE